MDHVRNQAIEAAVIAVWRCISVDSRAQISAAIDAYLAELGTVRVRKKSGSNWHGRIVGVYRTANTPVGYAVESEREPGSVQIYPASALEVIPDE